MPTLPSLLLLVSLAAPHPPPPPAEAPPAAASAEEQAGRIEIALGRIHGAPSPAEWRALGPGADELLARIAADDAALPSRRARAIAGLSFQGTDRAASVLGALVARDDLPYAVRAAAIRGAGRALPAAELPRLLAPALQARRAFDRSVAAETLALHSPAEACGTIRARAARSGEAQVLSRALARCAGTGR